ncbi:hypothetical protein [Escherichia phage 4E8]|uniref:Uncharacterized protein n=1 Tax=Escherichia phage vB_EcoP-101114UKE3 TaxID=2865794 RepID=A0AAE7XSU6_9CAUD|nr:hypothetical protein PQC43_gp080 [Escherichia phage vB_EcoP-101114UKE3]QZI79211.1 hypothetical protein 101114UKE3_080 [Escherichia phage vB_EcoP-101114UKE3]USM81184.1 hypothetical protein 101114BS3_057 [Escherichia phage vB_EcoP-101114BS3]WJJ57364.1 hypothetical protein [Escherichia phage 4E8]
MKKILFFLSLFSVSAIAADECISKDSGRGQIITQCGSHVTVVDSITQTVLVCNGTSCTKEILNKR